MDTNSNVDIFFFLWIFDFAFANYFEKEQTYKAPPNPCLGSMQNRYIYIISLPYKNSAFTRLVPHYPNAVSRRFPLISISVCSYELSRTADVHKVFSYD